MTTRGATGGRIIKAMEHSSATLVTNCSLMEKFKSPRYLLEGKQLFKQVCA